MDASSRQIKKEAAAPLAFVDLVAQQARIKGQLDKAIADVLSRGQYIFGPQVAELEAALTEFCGASHCVSCANGTDALILVLMAEGIGPGDAVFVPSFTFVATAEAVAARGAAPVFVDIDATTYNMNVASLSRAIDVAREAKLRPRMIIAVDLFGQPADYDAIGTAAREHGLTLVADAAQSFGASWRGRGVGTLADYTTTSFFPAKPLGCYGDGGAIFTEDSDKTEVLRSLRFHGSGAHKYEHARVGLNSRLDTLQAAILLAKLSIFSDEIKARQSVADGYAEILRGVETPTIAAGATSVWAQYTVRLPQGMDRDQIQATCGKAGVPTGVYYPIPLHRQAAYAQHPHDSQGMDVTDEAARRVLSLPIHPYLTPDTQRRIADALTSALKEQA